MKTRTLLVPSCLSALIYFSSVPACQSPAMYTAGRNALQTGRPNDAVGYLMRAADQTRSIAPLHGSRHVS